MCERTKEELERVINQILEEMGLEEYKNTTSKNGTKISWVRSKEGDEE